MQITRREWIAAGSGIAFGQQIALTQTASPQNAGWFDRPMRWAQVAFTEDDPGNYDLAMWLRYFKEIHADAACLSAGGCVAFYPTKIPLHYRSKFLGNRDAFGEFTEGCRSLGMNVIARTDPHACTEEAFAAHPEWVARTADGKPRRHWAAPDLYVTCALGPYNFDFMTKVTREIVTMYKVDGVFSNRWHGSGQCYCESCRKNFKTFSGFELPLGIDPANPARRKYIEWNQQRLFELWRLWDQTIRAVNPQATFIANSGGGALSELDMKTVGELSQTLFADKQARRGTMPPWANGKNGKEYRSTMGRKPIGGIFSVGVEEPYRWKDSVQSDAEIRLWAHNGIAHGLRPWFTKFNAKPLDERWMPVVSNIFNWHWKNEKYLRNEENLARVAIVYSQQTAHYYGGERAREKVEDPQLGFYQALIESRIPFEMVHDGLLDGAHVDRFALLILPNIAALSDAQCKQLEEYVSRGGSIVATYETSLYNEWGKRRSEFGLSKLFGCSFDGKIEDRMQNSYITVEHAVSPNPLRTGLEGTPRVINGVRRVVVRALDQTAKPLLTLVPTYPDLPMERVFTTTPHTNIPAVFLKEHGKGRVVYFPMDIDRTFWEVLSTDHLALLRNAVLWAAPKASPVRVNGSGVLDLACWRQKDSTTVHMVNLTNPMMMKGPIREVFPVGPFVVEVDLPAGMEPKEVKLLTAGTAAVYTRTAGGIRVEVPRVEVHEVIAIS